MNDPEALRAYIAGTVSLGDTTMIAVLDNTGKVWVHLKDFLNKNQAWLMTSPLLWRIPECPSAVVVCDGIELDFAGADALASLLCRPLQDFQTLPDPASRPVHKN